MNTFLIIGTNFSKVKKAYTRWSSLLEVAVKDLGIEMDNKVWWHARGIQLVI